MMLVQHVGKGNKDEAIYRDTIGAIIIERIALSAEEYI